MTCKGNALAIIEHRGVRKYRHRGTELQGGVAANAELCRAATAETVINITTAPNVLAGMCQPDAIAACQAATAGLPWSAPARRRFATGRARRLHYGNGAKAGDVTKGFVKEVARAAPGAARTSFLRVLTMTLPATVAQRGTAQRQRLVRRRGRRPQGLRDDDKPAASRRPGPGHTQANAGRQPRVVQRRGSGRPPRAIRLMYDNKHHGAISIWDAQGKQVVIRAQPSAVPGQRRLQLGAQARHRLQDLLQRGA